MMRSVLRVYVFMGVSMNAAAAFCAEAVPGADRGLFTSEMSTARKIADMVIEYIVRYSFQALGGIVIIFAGWLVAGFAAKLISRFLHDKKVDVTVSKFMTGIVRLGIIGFAVLIALGEFGITIAPFVAGLSVVGFGTSFALQGPLSNYAAGVSLIFTKPFKVGDVVELTGYNGEVMDMTLSRTELRTLDDTTIFVPNKQIIGEIIHNYSSFKKLDIRVGVSYDTDIEKALGVIRKIVAEDARIAKIPEPKMGISKFGESSITLYARIRCFRKDYWDVLFDVNERIFRGFQSGGIRIPFPQREIKIINKEA
ncbi:MAG: mechanosensitive ion channel [Candidatus Omnitrophica bacterium]|nr:mechanosensitive ion channel [Candidatus Omnitrophota bacterium]